MSAEGKKKRGESGLKNAQNIPFRYGGKPCDCSTTPRPSRSIHGNGSQLVQAMLLGNMLHIKHPMQPFGLPFAEKIENAMRRCTHPTLHGEA